MPNTFPSEKLWTPSFVYACFANFLLYFGFYMLVPTLPFYLIDAFKASPTMIGFVLAAYSLMALIVRPFSGFLVDNFARKPLFLLSFFASVLVLFGYIWASSLLLFILLRMAHGMAFGTVTTAGITIAIDVIPASRRGEGIGYYGATNTLAMAFGPMAGLFLYDRAPFTIIFLLAILTGVVGLGFATFIKVHQRERVVAQVLSLDRFFLLNGIPFGITVIFMAAPYAIVTSYMALYVHEMGIDAGDQLFFMLFSAGIIFSRLTAGIKIDRGNILQIIMIGIALTTISFFLLAATNAIVLFGIGMGNMVFYAVSLMMGVGYGMLFPALNSLFVSMAPHNRRGTANSTYLTSWDFGMGLGFILGGLLVQVAGYSFAYLVGGSLLFCAAILCRWYSGPHYLAHKFV